MRIAAGDLAAVIFGEVPQELERVRIRIPVVRVHESDIFARGVIKREVARDAGAEILLAENLYAWMCRRIFLENLQRRILRAIINADYLDIRQSLRQDGIEALGEIFLGVEYGDYDGNSAHFASFWVFLAASFILRD